MVIGRFAPSPSGRMHLGNLFSALLAWLSVRAQDGEMLLRIEDLDTARCRPEYIAQLKDDLRWLGLDWDRETQPQSERGAIYSAYVEQLRAKGLIYPCWCSRSDLRAASAPHASDGKLIYPGTCRHLTASERAQRVKTPALRVIVPDQVYEFVDGKQGLFRENLARGCGDFVVRKADGTHAYQLAVVVDDALSGVTEVVRGRDLLDSTPRQLYLYEQLGFPAPRYYHVPLLEAADGHRLSKREHDLDMGALRDRYTPEELLGKLANLAGLWPENTPATTQELVRTFDWSKVRAGNITIDV
jgi:glutamyl-tRNA synthetase